MICLTNNILYINDETLSDLFRLNSNGSAVYVNFSSSIQRFSYSAGLRTQWDRIAYNSRIKPGKADRHYLNFFPSVSLGYFLDKDETMSLNLSYTRGIQYMPFNEISPVIRFQSEYSYTKGNPDLEPAFFHALQFSASIKNWDIYYNYECIPNMIHYLTFIDNKDPLIKYSMPMNSSEITGHIVGFTREFDVTKWWNLSVDLMLRNRKTCYKEQNVRKSSRSTAYFADISNYFIFNDTFGGEINFYGETAEKIDDKTLFPVFSIGAAVYKYFLKKKILLKLSANQIMYKLRSNLIDKDIYWSRSRFLTNQTSLSFNIQYNFRSSKSIEVKRLNKLQSLQKREEKE